MAMASSPVLIVGAGMAGLTAARVLHDAGIDSIVVDKGRAVGGRMATRTVDGARFDHGAQHFSARSDEFRAMLDDLVEADVVVEWYRSESLTNPDRGVEPRHVGLGGMRRVPEHLARGLDVRTPVVVERLEMTVDGVTALVDGLPVATGAAAILTPPLPQTRDLLAASGIDLDPAARAMLDPIDYDACLAVMAHLNGPSGLPDGHATPGDGGVAWVADNQHKGTSPLPAITIHSTPEFAADRLEDDPRDWVADLVAATEPHLASSVVSAGGHRWRYAMPRRTLDIGTLPVSDDPPILLAGEVFAGARVEGAFRSGLAAAHHLLGASSAT